MYCYKRWNCILKQRQAPKSKRKGLHPTGLTGSKTTGVSVSTVQGRYLSLLSSPPPPPPPPSPPPLSPRPLSVSSWPLFFLLSLCKSSSYSFRFPLKHSDTPSQAPSGHLLPGFRAVMTSLPPNCEPVCLSLPSHGWHTALVYSDF